MTASVLTVTGLSILIPFFAFISITPGMCMTLSLSLGASIGFRRTIVMMIGELVGVGVIVACVIFGVATIMLENPNLFSLFKIGGGLYLMYLGVQLFLSKGKMKLSLDNDEPIQFSKFKLASQGFVTAIFNPKGWAFFVALLPGFVDYQQSIELQLLILLLLILPIEFISLCIYAYGGNFMRKIMNTTGNVKLINKGSGLLMGLVGIWLMMS